MSFLCLHRQIISYLSHVCYECVCLLYYAMCLHINIHKMNKKSYVSKRILYEYKLWYTRTFAPKYMIFVIWRLFMILVLIRCFDSIQWIGETLPGVVSTVRYSLYNQLFYRVSLVFLSDNDPSTMININNRKGSDIRWCDMYRKLWNLRAVRAYYLREKQWQRWGSV